MHRLGIVQPTCLFFTTFVAVVFASLLSCAASAQAPEGLPPDVWCQLPYAVLTAAQRCLSESHLLDNHDSPVDEVLKAVMQEATSSLWVLNEHHRKQQQELKQQMQAMQVQFAKEQEQRQQEVGGLRGALAAMAAQMQAMQQQLQQHLGR